MKKRYIKPEMTIMELRPEEKLAYCDWPVGFMAGGGGCQEIWADVPAYASMCQSMYDDAMASGS